MKKEQKIVIKGARENNLKNIDLEIPKNKLVVVTGVSGSGKSSIAFDTLYAEGQRRYVESLSSYARQFLNRMKKPDVDYIHGICPAIAIEQKVSTSNARSTVGSLTEIYDYLRLLFARIGKTISPVSGDEVKKHQVSDVVDYIEALSEGAKVLLMIPLNQNYPDRRVDIELELLLKKGYTRIYHNGTQKYIEDILSNGEAYLNDTIGQFTEDNFYILIDRFVVKYDDEENTKRIADSVLTAFNESGGSCLVREIDKEAHYFNNRFELDGLVFIEPSPQLFNYNNPYGACPRCEGFGRVMGISEEKVVPDPKRSIYDEAVQCWRGQQSSEYLNQLIINAHKVDFPIHTAYRDLSSKYKQQLWNGTPYFKGINDYFEELQEKSYKIQNRVLISRYRGRTTCPVCFGGRLRQEALYVQVVDHTIRDLILMPLDELKTFFDKIKLTDHNFQIAKRILHEIISRLNNLNALGLGYLHLDRVSSTLSGGETQRINLTKSLGSNLTNSLYVLDEPSIGLHPKDTARLVEVLEQLRDLGNTVMVVEHEEEVIRHSDYLIDIGPEAGIHGGQVVYAGPFQQIDQNGLHSLTLDYLNGHKEVIERKHIRKWNNKILVKQSSLHNLDVENIVFPLNVMTVVSGVSGSGKSTLVEDVLYKQLMLEVGREGGPDPAANLNGDLHMITQVEMIAQSPIGRSSRSNPITYVKAYDSIRKLMSKQQIAKVRGYAPGHFSFNIEGGRCETCKGDGEITVEMQFLADVKLVCEDCNGKRFKPEVLEVKYKGKNISDILNLTIEEALEFFKTQKDIIKKIQPLYDVGLGYVQLGQSSSTLSGGEAQRVKLAYYLGKEQSYEQILFIFDEPTTGLHFHDINNLLKAFDALIEKGHTIIVIEHNLDIIKNADWVIDLGPGGGKYGGQIVFQGPGSELIESTDSITAAYLKSKVSPVES